jgi:pimeloyl-ACP methyl ester carboxylesterase
MLGVAGLLVGCLYAAVRIAVRNYQAAHALLTANPASSLLKNPGLVNLDNLQSVSFISNGVQLAGWYIPSKNRAAVLVAHGTNSDRSSMLAETRLLSVSGFGVLAFDWPGLGESGGQIRWGAQARDAASAAVDWLTARADVDPTRIGALGFSMGGFILAQVAAKDSRVCAVVLESVPTDFHQHIDIHNAKWGWLSRWPALWALRDSGLLASDESAVRLVGQISPRPVFIIGENRDPEVPISMTRDLNAAARAPKQLWLIDGASHGGYAEVAGGEYERRVRDFFEANLTGCGGHRSSH